ncbi:methyltransferase family protein [Serratia fonticola]|uniref:methyltransferase family protein n=1 Tax=Serratia fonticola TaxID=47917 RepID=UPI0028004AAD|nr:methyltransferase [Serratia fonticola]MDQ7209601.1 methyltransferase [Serratia fonticola]HBE9079527.1 isoprenylcysteine carboxylmethyltransferase family protein [Serratia fonticola]HBE9088917.1 isoprenylcysteine carboxylmethyltransferase family protein [Serratia fonticola]HBE9152499.1 isoprenylcysteine carboxylmethyltransferase family protein [Serratia fonticola]
MVAWLQRLVLPPVVMAVCAAGMAATCWLTEGGWQDSLLILLAAGVLAVASVTIMFSASYAFHRAGTTLHPQKFQRVSALLVTGVFRFSRNPVYLGQILLLAAWGLLLGGIGVWLWWGLFFAYLDRVQIPREEAFLRDNFGQDYRGFCDQVRRWF